MNVLLGVILLFSPLQQDTLKTKQLEEVVISASRGNDRTPITQYTIDVSSLTATYSGQELPVALINTPSFTFYSDGGNSNGYSYYRLRGIDQTRINMTLNGIPLNEPEDQGAYFTNYPDFLNSVRSVQIQRGVGMSQNGVAAFAGAINLESPSLHDSAYTDLQFSVGSFNSLRYSGEFNSGIRKNFGFYGRISKLSTDGFRTHSGHDGGSIFLSGGYFGKKSLIKFTGFIGQSINDMAYLAVSESDLNKDYRMNYLTPDEKDKFQQSLLSLQYSYNLTNKSYLTSTVYFNRLQGNYDIYFDPDMLNFALSSNWYGVFVNYHYDSDRFGLVAGIHTNDYKRNHFLRIKPDLETNLYYNTGHKEELSGFVRSNYEISNVSLYGDIQLRTAQFTYIPDTDYSISSQSIRWNFVNPKFGINYVYRNKTIYSSIGLTHREPTRTDMFAGYDDMDESNFTEIGDLSRVRPERVVDIELGMRMKTNKTSFDINLYSMQFTNEIAAIGQLSYIGLPLRKNVASSSRVGLEIDMVTNLIRNVTTRTSANISKSNIKEYTTDFDDVTYKDVTPLLTPSLILNQTIDYRISKFTLGNLFRYVSSSFLDNTENNAFVVPRTFYWDSNVKFQLSENLSASLAVNNVLNTKWFTSGYVANNESHYFAMATRNYMLTLKCVL